MNLEKNLADQNIMTAIAEANHAGFTVAVASDPEANTANIISTLPHSQFDQEEYSDDFIFLGVLAQADMDLIFLP
jgi:PleD family two-component response regulator